MTTDSETNSPERKKPKRKSKSPSSPTDKNHKGNHSPDPEKQKSKDKQHRKKRSDRSRSRDRREKRSRRYESDKDTFRDENTRRENNDYYWNKYPKKDGKRNYESEAKRSEKRETDATKQNEDKSIIKPRERKTVDLLTSRTGGAYIPPAKLRMMQENITDKSSAAYQRIAWEALKKSVHGYINKVNTSNIGIIARELLHENIVRGRGLLCKSIIQAQAASPTFTNVYAALVAVINSKFPSIGELLLKRLVLQFKRGFKQNNKIICISAATFIAHLVNQRVAHEILALEILTLLVETPTDDSVEVAISFLKESGQKLTEVSSRGINAIFEMLRNILHEGQLEKRIQYMIEVMFQIRKDGFKDHAAVTEDLDVVEEEDQFTHLITLDDVKQVNAEDVLNVFKFDENYEENEGKYKTLSKEILQSDSESGSGSDDSDGDSDDEGDEEEEEGKEESKIIDNTETNLITLRRTIYLTIQSSLDFEECAHKLLKMELKPGQEIELCHMFLDCCAEQRTYEKFYGLLAQRFCQINKTYVEPFQQIFKDTYATTHRLDANRLRNVSKFFAHLLFTDAIGWEVLEIMKLNEEDTNSSSRIFIKILFQELSEYMGLGKLNARLKDPTFQEHFAGLFPRDSPKNTRFSINFFTSIGLGGLTDELREHLKNIPKNFELNIGIAKESGSSSNSSSESSEAEESSDSSSSSEEENQKKKKKRKDKNGPKGAKRAKKQKASDSSGEEEPSRNKNKKKNKPSDMEEDQRRVRRNRDEDGEERRRRDYEGWEERRRRDREAGGSKYEERGRHKDEPKTSEKSSRRRSRSYDTGRNKERYRRDKEKRERRKS
ncbi:pre-mRNA-splicing factor CWC22 homolog [Anoplophora glabripennis]|uniref:pre-mRNA-splicing factor CWC22 homolog n=1 Tax=Anoplophora glabripennis TaxID=217634 RepID=UPI0008752F91|nr:pre-mRNA-splicing factor CWC22 homolog [Anoplophora glabripennis]XP_018569653.1 pre-mRNA-splicing factor CWC22 homolog [Anoplophora glabripennis]